MADRSVKVTVSANVAPLKRAMADGSRSVEGLAKTSRTMGSRIKSSLAFVGVAGGIASVGSAIKGTFKLGMDFTEQLNTLQAVSGATADQMAKVSEKARALGNDVEIPATSASDAAEAMTELAKGGLSVQQSMDAAKGTLQLAAAAQVSGAQAATIQANALNTFGLKASDAGKVADVLANTANAASGEITDFAQAFQQSGSVAKLFGIKIDDAATALGLFANNGIRGSDAGTSLKTMLTQLATPSAKAKAAMDKLGLTIYDNQGKFVGLRSLTQQLAKAQDNMSQASFQSAAGIVFGSDAIRAASILASSGVTAYDDFKASVDRVGGAADLANAKMKGLPGAFQQAENAIQDVALQMYDALAPSVEKVVRGFTDAIPKIADVVVPVFKGVFKAISGTVDVLGKLFGWVSSLPGPIKTAVTALAGFAIAKKVGLFGRFAGVLARVKQELAFASYAAPASKSLGTLGSAASLAKTKVLSLAKSLGKGALLGAGIWVVSEIAGAFQKIAENSQHAEAATKDLSDALVDAGGHWDDAAKKQRAAKIEGMDSFDALIKAGISYSDIMAGMTGDTGDFNRLLAEIGKKDGGLLFDSLDELKKMHNAVTVNAEDLAKQKTAYEQSTKAATSQQEAQDRYVDSLVRSHDAASQNFEDTTRQNTAYNDARRALNNYADVAKVMNDRVQREAQDTSDRVLATARSFQTAGGDAGIFATKLDGVKAAMDRLAGKTPDVDEATRRFNGTLTQAKEAAKDADGNIKMYSSGLVDASGKINTASKSGQDLYDIVTQQADAARDLARAQADAAGATGGVTAAADAAGRSLQQSRQDFIDNAKQMGLTKEAAKRLADQYYGLPKDIKIEVYGVSDFSDVDRAIQARADSTVYVNVQGHYVGTTGMPTKTFGLAMNHAADGGAITGPGAKGVDSKLMMLAPGEHVLTDDDVDAMGGQGNVYAFRRWLHSGKMGMASGGSLGGFRAPTRSALAGTQPVPLGPVVSTIIGAMASFRDAILATAGAAKDAAAKARDAAKAYRQQVADQRQTARQQRANVAEARKTQNQRVADARQDLARARADAKRERAQAQARVRAAKPGRERQDARRRLADVNRSNARSVADATKRLNRAEQARTATINKAVAAQRKANTAEREKTAAARRATNAAHRQLATAKKEAAATRAASARTKALRREQTALGKTLDQVNNKLADAKDALTGLKDARNQLSSSISGTITGNASIMGMDANGVGGLLAGLKSNLNTAKGFRYNLNRLSKRGLDAGVLSEIASGGLAASPLARALAHASPGQIKKLNSLQAQIEAVAGKTGNLVANNQYGQAIRGQTAIVGSISHMGDVLEKALRSNATQLDKALERGLKGMRVQVQIGNQSLDAEIRKVLRKTDNEQGRILAGAG